MACSCWVGRFPPIIRQPGGRLPMPPQAGAWRDGGVGRIWTAKSRKAAKTTKNANANALGAFRVSRNSRAFAASWSKCLRLPPFALGDPRLLGGQPITRVDPLVGFGCTSGWERWPRSTREADPSQRATLTTLPLTWYGWVTWLPCSRTRLQREGRKRRRGHKVLPGPGMSPVDTQTSRHRRGRPWHSSSAQANRRSRRP